MPITKSAQKATRASARKRVFNLARKNAMKESIKAFRLLIANQKFDEAKQFMSVLYKAIDKAAKRGVIKSGAAARRKSRLARLVVPI